MDMGKKAESIFRRRRKNANASVQLAHPPKLKLASTSAAAVAAAAAGIGGTGENVTGGISTNDRDMVGKKKSGTQRLWMRFDPMGHSELIECDKSAIFERAYVHPRDLRIIGPIFSHCSSILAREKAMIVNLEYIRAIVTAEEVLLLDPLRQEVLPFVDRLRRQLTNNNAFKSHGNDQIGKQELLPFEFQVLEIALEMVCAFLDFSVAKLERDAYPVLDELLAMDLSRENLEQVLSLKTNLTRLLARVQKVRGEIEQLLDDNEDMTKLCLTRKWIQNQQLGAMASNSIVPAATHLQRPNSNHHGHLNGNDVEDLEMLLEAYFIQLDGTRNKILSVREYIDDAEVYVNIQLDNQRNELTQLQLTLNIASFAIAVETVIAGIFGMNIKIPLNNAPGVFWPVVAWSTAGCILIFFLLVGYARWKKLLGS